MYIAFLRDICRDGKDVASGVTRGGSSPWKCFNTLWFLLGPRLATEELLSIGMYTCSILCGVRGWESPPPPPVQNARHEAYQMRQESTLVSNQAAATDLKQWLCRSGSEPSTPSALTTGTTGTPPSAAAKTNPQQNPAL